MNYESFLARYPIFEPVSQTIVEIAIDDAQTEVYQPIWGKLYTRGVAALSAHLLVTMLDATTLQKLGLSPVGNGAVASESAGELSVSYVTPSDLSALEMWYTSTPYGTEYIRLRKLVAVGVGVSHE